MKAIRKVLDTPEFKGSSVAKVKKLCFEEMSPRYRDIKVSVRFPNGGIGEIILVEAALNDAKFNRGGHLLYDVTRELEPYRRTNKKAHDAYHALAKLSKLVYQTDEPVDSATFARAKSVASNALEGLGEESQNLSLSSSVATMVKSSDSLLKKVTPASVVSAATPSSSLIQNISKDMISNVDRNVNDDEHE